MSTDKASVPLRFRSYTDSYLSQRLLDKHNEEEKELIDIVNDEKKNKSDGSDHTSQDNNELHCLDDGNNKLKYSHVMYSSKESFFVELMQWIITTLILLCCIILSPLFLFMSIIIFCHPLTTILKIHYIILLILLCLPILYVLSVYAFINIEVAPFYSLAPTILAVIFKDAIIFSSKFKYTAERIYAERELSGELDFSCTPFCLDLCHCPICCCFCCGIPYILSLICYLNGMLFSKLMAVFLKSYHIWGITLNDYTPFNECTVQIHNDKCIEGEKVIQPMFDLLPIVRETVQNLAPIYSTKNKMFKYCMLLFIWIAIIIPHVYSAFMFLSDSVSVTIGTITIWIFGLLATIFVFVSINQFIEIIFYRLIKYYSYMNRMNELIMMPQTPIRGDIEIAVKGNFDVGDNILDGGSNADSAHIDILLEFNRKTQVNMKEIKFTIYLWQEENSIVWFENWCRIETVASLYFQNQKSVVFAIFTSLISCSILILYYYFNDTTDDIMNIVDGFTLLAFCIILYFFVVLLRLLFWAMAFSKLESRQIQSIECQKIRIMHYLFALNKNKKNDDMEAVIMDQKMMNSYNLTSRFLDDIMAKIQRRSVSPKISGVKLDKILVKLIISSLIGILLSAFSFLFSISNR